MCFARMPYKLPPSSWPKPGVFGCPIRDSSHYESGLPGRLQAAPPCRAEACLQRGLTPSHLSQVIQTSGYKPQEAEQSPCTIPGTPFRRPRARNLYTFSSRGWSRKRRAREIRGLSPGTQSDTPQLGQHSPASPTAHPGPLDMCSKHCP